MSWHDCSSSWALYSRTFSPMPYDGGRDLYDRWHMGRKPTWNASWALCRCWGGLPFGPAFSLWQALQAGLPRSGATGRSSCSDMGAIRSKIALLPKKKDLISLKAVL